MVKMIQKGSKTQIIDKGGAFEFLDDLYQERAAIMQYDGGMSKEEAEQKASN